LRREIPLISFPPVSLVLRLIFLIINTSRNLAIDVVLA
jgi:hypothetical protein